MPLSQADVRHIATLSRLEFDRDQLDDFQVKLDRILAFVDQLTAVDMDGVEPMAHPLDLTQRLRADEADTGIDRDRIQQNARETTDGYYRVPKVIE
ncbi:MAG: Asp-tRNA(Asn)/Glu-tRNA(Gln) amidotransferase subunit GatC [Pseudomonadota bacterium]